ETRGEGRGGSRLLLSLLLIHIWETSRMRPAINFRRPETILGLVFILILGYLIVVPLFVLLKTTFVWGPADLRLRGVNVQLGAATLYHWKQMLSGPLAQAAFYRPLLNTLVVTAGTLVIILGISSILAYLVVRTDLRWKKWIANLAIVPYILPSWVLAQAWLQVVRSEEHTSELQS